MLLCIVIFVVALLEEKDCEKVSRRVVFVTVVSIEVVSYAQ